MFDVDFQLSLLGYPGGHGGEGEVESGGIVGLKDRIAMIFQKQHPRAIITQAESLLVRNGGVGIVSGRQITRREMNIREKNSLTGLSPKRH